jgi:putative DNA primase/helicase
VKEQIPHGERTYLAVPYEERDQAKAIGARWDAVKKAWYVGPGVEPDKIAKWELRHEVAATVDPRAEFAEVLREIGAIVEGEHPVMNGEPQRIRTENDKRGERTIFYIGHLDGVANGYAENNRTKEVRRWKARGQGLSEEQKSELLAKAEKKRYERRRQERERFEATADRLSELRSLPSGVQKTAYHEAKGIELLPGASVRNGDVLVPGYDVDGKLWTIQYIKEDGTKRFAKDSRKHGCFHVVGAANAADGLQKLANSPVIALAEGYATAATVATYGNVPAVAAFDSGNLLAVATALHERWPDKGIMIAGDDDHKLENNPGRVKALEAALAVGGMAVFPNSTAEQREKGLTDFNDLARENARLAKHQLEEAVWRARQQGQERTREMEKGVLALNSWAGRSEIPCEILKETPHRFLVRLRKDCLLPGGRQASKGGEVYVPKDAVERVAEQSMEARIEERV